MRIMKWFFLVVVLVALGGPMANAQSIVTAASCSQSAVEAVINGPTHTAVNGDTIVIPACSGGSSQWTSTINIPSGVAITITGTGTPNSTPGNPGASSTCQQTVLVGNGEFFRATPAYGAPLMRISCMELTPYATATNPALGVNGSCTASGCPNLRLDNLTVPDGWSFDPHDASFASISNVFGVADHNTVGDSSRGTGNGTDFINLGHGTWLSSSGGYGDLSWASADTFGTSQAFFLEDNVFDNAFGTDTDLGDITGGGARLACRFNVFNNMTPAGACSGHGTDTTGRPRGVRQWEGYWNTGTCSNSSLGCGSMWPGRSGTGMSFANTVTNVGSGFFETMTSLDSQLRWRPSAVWGTCDGSAPWNVNDTNGGGGNTAYIYYTGTVGSASFVGSNWTITDSNLSAGTTNQWCPKGAPYSYHNTSQSSSFSISSNTSHSFVSQGMCISGCTTTSIPAGNGYQIMRAFTCIDQPARGAGALVQGNPPVLVSTGNPGSVAEVLDPVYEADDAMGIHASATIGLDVNMEYYRDVYAETVNQAAQSSPTSPFNGTNGNGTGHGTLANRPPSCTQGAGYWATDQGSWNTSTGANAGKQGMLYICQASGWPSSPSYTPYTYPHPLITGGTSGASVNPPTGLVATVQ